MAYGYGQFRDWPDLGEELRPGLYDEQRQVLRGGGLPEIIRFDEDPTGANGLPVGRTAAQEAAMAAEAAAIAEEVAQRRIASGEGATIRRNDREFYPVASTAPVRGINIVNKDGRVVGRTYRAVLEQGTGAPEPATPQKAAPKQELYWAGGQRVEAPKPKIQPPLSAIERHMAGEKVIAAPPDWRRTPISRVSTSQQAPQPIEATPAAEMELARFLRERGAGETMPDTNDSEHAYITGALGLKAGQNVALWDIIDEGRRREERRAAYQARMGKPVTAVTPGTTPEIIERLLPFAVTGPGLEAERRARITAADLGNRGLEVAQINDAAFPRDPEGNPAGGMQIGQPVTDPIRLEGPITRTNFWPSEPGVRVDGVSSLQGIDPAFIEDELRLASDGRGGPSFVEIATTRPDASQFSGVGRKTVLLAPNTEVYSRVPGFNYGPDDGNPYGADNNAVPTVADAARAIRAEASTRLIGAGPLEEAQARGDFIADPAYEQLLQTGAIPGDAGNRLGLLRGTPVFMPDEGGVTLVRTLPDPADPRGGAVDIREPAYRIGSKYPQNPDELRAELGALLEEQGMTGRRGTALAVGESFDKDRMRRLVSNPAVTLTDARTGEVISRAGAEEEILARLAQTATPMRAEWETAKGPQSMNIIEDPIAREQRGRRASVVYAEGMPDPRAGQPLPTLDGPVATIEGMRERLWAANIAKRRGLGESDAGVILGQLASGSSSRSLPTVSQSAFERALQHAQTFRRGR